MGWDPPKGLKYLYKRIRLDVVNVDGSVSKCASVPTRASTTSRNRFAKVEGDNKRLKVFSICNPVGASKPPSYLQRWDGKTFTLEQCRPFEGSLSALAVSDNGTFVATGSMFDGSVEIFIAYNLMVRLHNLFFRRRLFVCRRLCSCYWQATLSRNHFCFRG